MNFTPSQRAAIETNGNVLVAAGAGAGKTRTLVERCLARLLDPHAPAGLQEMLMVTFTEAAAAEMKHRIGLRLTEALAQGPGEAGRSRLEEQLALLDTAPIGTLHGFCLQLIREHFHELAFDPQMTVLAEEQALLLMEETLDEILKAHYAGATGPGLAVQELIAVQACGREPVVRELVFKIHHYTQTLPDPAAWFQKELAAYRQAEPGRWQSWWLDGFRRWIELWLPQLRAQPAENERARRWAARFEALKELPSRPEAAELLREIVMADADWPRGTKGKFRVPIEEFYDDAAFLHSLAAGRGEGDPLVEDWNWVRRQMESMLHLAEEFSRAFATAKREQGSVDFHDFEQFALRLLWDKAAGCPTPLARGLRRKFKFVFVDEYQDINAAQDKIIEALSGEGATANRFLVGDAKQSIYRFRLSDPRIFQRYRREWRSAPERGRVIPLAENFRSREALLRFVNPIFAALLREEIGGLGYGAEDELQFGAPEQRGALAAAASVGPQVEVCLRLTGEDRGNDEFGAEKNLESPGEALTARSELTDAEGEARLIARRLRQLMAEQHPVWDDREGNFRAVKWSDMVILLRAVRHKAEAYAKEFHRQGVPLQAERGGFYDTAEIADLLSLLQLLDNPLQDVPLLAVLRSPLAGLTVNELAEIRLVHRHGHFWTALQRWREIALGQPAKVRSSTPAKVDLFLKRFARWRRMSRATSLSQRLEAILNETHYSEWLLTQPRGEQRQANLGRLLARAQRFDPFQRQGLQRFLRFVEAERAAAVDSEPATIETANAVQLMSIHKSKGLEYPVVVVADLGKRFNLRDLSDGVVLDEDYGLCPQVQPPQTGRHYPSLPYWLAAKRQRREALGEELRLLYVAMTRAKDTLILAGTTPRKAATEKWPVEAADRFRSQQILAANSYLDWLGPWLTQQIGDPGWTGRARGQTTLFSWMTHGVTEELAGLPRDSKAAAADEVVAEQCDSEMFQHLKARLEWRYPFPAATRLPAKTSVSALRRQRTEEDEEARPLFPVAIKPRTTRSAARLSAAETGIAHHAFLETVALDRVSTARELKDEAERLRQAGTLAPEQVAVLDFAGLAAFWKSEPGRHVLAHAGNAHRELPFTAGFSPADLSALKVSVAAPLPPDEFIVVQGVVDLAVILPEAIRLVDFKTDQVQAGEVPEKVKLYEPQLGLYALALSRIYRRPVSECWLYFLTARQAVLLR